MTRYNRGVESYRLFIAAKLPTDVQRYLATIRANLARRVTPDSVRWVAPDALHLTLAFLGDWPLTHLLPVSDQMVSVAQQHRAVALRLGGLGTFPNARRPGVIWAGLHGEPAALNALQAIKYDLDVALQTLGWKAEDRAFTPHLTLGRVNGRLPADALPADLALRPLHVPIDALHLIRSDLRPGGARYTTLKSAPLA